MKHRYPGIRKQRRFAHGQAIFESSAAMLLFLIVFVALLLSGTLVFVLISFDERLKLICTQVALASQQDEYFVGMPRKDLAPDGTADAQAIKLGIQIAKAEGLPLTASDIQIAHSTQEHGIDSSTCTVSYGSFKLPALAKIFPGICGRRVSITVSNINSQPAPAVVHICANTKKSGPLSLALLCYAGYRAGLGASSASTGRLVPNFPGVSFTAGDDPGPGGLRARHTYGLRLSDPDNYLLDGPIDGKGNYETSGLEPQQPFINLQAP
jgi:hypothetical protein